MSSRSAEERGDRQRGTFNNVHSTTVIFIQHPLRDQNLHSTGECYLHLVQSEGGTLPHPRHRHAVMRMVRIVNRGGAQNMGIV